MDSIFNCDLAYFKTVSISGSIGPALAAKTASAPAIPPRSTDAFTLSARTKADWSLAAVTSKSSHPSIRPAQCPIVRIAAARTFGSSAEKTLPSNAMLGIRWSSKTHKHSNRACDSSRSRTELFGFSDAANLETSATMSVVLLPDNSNRAR